MKIKHKVDGKIITSKVIDTIITQGVTWYKFKILGTGWTGLIKKSDIIK